MLKNVISNFVYTNEMHGKYSNILFTFTVLIPVRTHRYCKMRFFLKVSENLFLRQRIPEILKNAQDGEENVATSFGALAIAKAHFSGREIGAEARKSGYEYTYITSPEDYIF